MRKTLILCLGMVGFSLGMFTKTFANERIVASKHHITRVIEVGAFDHIQLNGSTDIIYTPTTGQQKLSLTLPDNLVDVVQVYVKDCTLFMEMKSSASVEIGNGSRVELYVAAPMVESVTLNGSGDISISSHAVSQKSLDLTINGSGDIDSKDIQSSALTATVNGCGDMNVGKITANQVQATVNGAGDLTVSAIQAECLNATVNGVGDLTAKGIQAKQATAAVNGMGDVHLMGCCEEANYELAGMGDISAKRLKAKKVTAHIIAGMGDIDCYASESIVMIQKRNQDAITYIGNPKHVERKHK